MDYKVKKKVQIYVMIGVPFILFVMFVVYPLLWNMRYSFFNYNGVQETFIGVDNFVRVLTDKVWWQSVYNTFVFACGKLVFTIPLAFVLAIILNSNLKGSAFFRAGYYLTHVVSTAIISMVFLIMLSSYNGIINEYLRAAHIIEENINWLGQKSTAMLSVILISVWKDFGYEAILVLAGLQSIPEDVYESAAIDGANLVQKHWYITLPLIGPVLRVIIMLAIVNSLKIFDLVNVLTAGGPNHATDVMMTYVYSFYFGGEGQLPQQGYAAAVSVVASVIIAIVTLVYLKVSGKEDAE